MPDYAARIAHTQAEMERLNVDALFVRPSPDLAYLSGFRMVPFSSAMMYTEMWLPESWVFGVWLFREGDPIMTVPARFHRAIGQYLLPKDIRIAQDHADACQLVRSILSASDRPIRNLGIEKETQGQLIAAVRDVLPDVSLSLAWRCTERGRQVKDAEELALMRKASAMTDKVFGAVVSRLKPGITEMDVIAEVDYQALRHGAEGMAFTTGVSIGNAGSLRPAGLALPRRVIQPGDHLSFDLGVVADGYCSDFGRTVSFGEPNADLKRAFATVYAMQMMAFHVLSEPGHVAQDIDAAVREVCRAAGYAAHTEAIGLPNPPLDPRDKELEANGRFYHGVGHSIGLEVHEFPFMQYTNQEPIVPNMIFASEPSLIKPNSFGCRIEDTILVTETGAEWLENYPREIIVVE